MSTFFKRKTRSCLYLFSSTNYKFGTEFVFVNPMGRCPIIGTSLLRSLDPVKLKKHQFQPRKWLNKLRTTFNAYVRPYLKSLVTPLLTHMLGSAEVRGRIPMTSPHIWVYGLLLFAEPRSTNCRSLLTYCRAGCRWWGRAHMP